MLHCEGPAVLVVEEVHGGDITDGHLHQLAALVIVGVEHTVHGLACPQPICTIGIGNIIGAVGCGRQLPAVFPPEAPPGAVVVTGGITVCALGSTMESEDSMVDLYKM